MPSLTARQTVGYTVIAGMVLVVLIALASRG